MTRMVIGRGLVVRQRDQIDKRAGGVLIPRLFRAEDHDFTDTLMMAALGGDLIREHGILTGQLLRYMPSNASWDQEWADEYHKACNELDKTPAGKRAEELLMSFLTPDQERTARLYRYIDYFLIHKRLIEDRLKKGKIPHINCVRVRFKRGFPNGNIKLGSVINGRMASSYTICYHPTVPYPTDDIVLAQIIALLSDPDELVRQGNATDGLSNIPFHFKHMYSPAPKPPKLVLPFGHSQEIESNS